MLPDLKRCGFLLGSTGPRETLGWLGRPSDGDAPRCCSSSWRRGCGPLYPSPIHLPDESRKSVEDWVSPGESLGSGEVRKRELWVAAALERRRFASRVCCPFLDSYAQRLSCCSRVSKSCDDGAGVVCPRCHGGGVLWGCFRSRVQHLSNSWGSGSQACVNGGFIA